MAKRRRKAGKRAGQTAAPTKHDVQDWRRLVRKAGGPDKVLRWIGEETLPETLREDFDNFVLADVAFMEETTWKYQRSPEAKHLFKKPTKLGERMRPITREEHVRSIVAGVGETKDAAGQRIWTRKELGASKEAVIKRIIGKDRARGGKY